jgi:glycerophosphoryl diester phosphodiesterase
MPAIDWLTARPVAHRGLHDEANGIIENTTSAVRAAIEANYGIEVDLQITADGEAVVQHDDVLGRLTDGEGRLDAMTVAEIKRVPFRGSADRIMTLGELCDLVAGRITMLLELKSRFDGDGRLPARVCSVLAGYRGPVAPMSFDPMQLAALRRHAPQLVCGVIAAKYRPHPYWDLMQPWTRKTMAYLLPAISARPQFVAYSVGDLPALAPLAARHILGLPLLTWAVRTPAEREVATRWADQMIFEGFRP